jgi:HlyD family secretion protein
MPESEEINKIEIRSEEVQDILGAIPSWILRAGISTILIVVIILLIGSWFFKYPDIIQARITLSTKNPPTSLIALSTGEITDLLAQEKQIVTENEIIAVLENSGNYSDIIQLETILDTISNPSCFIGLEEYKLGEIQQSYSTFLRLIKDYYNFKKLDYYSQKIESIKQQMIDYKLFYDRLWLQKNLREENVKISELQFNRDKSLFEKGVYSKLDYENAEKLFLEEKLSFESTRATLANTQIQINQLDQQILDLKLQETDDLRQREIAIEEAYTNLRSDIAKWKQTYLIESPIKGRVTYTKIWSKNQNVKTGEIVATVIPIETTSILGRLEIPSVGVGKVRIGQTVNVKLDNFPHMEYGLLKCSINSISLIPTETSNGIMYTAEILMSDTLISNYGKHLAFSQEMTGTAEIITDDVRLLERFLNPIKSVWKKNVE